MSHEASTDPQGLTVGNLLSLPPTIDVELAGRAFGIGRTTAYQLARSGSSRARSSGLAAPTASSPQT